MEHRSQSNGWQTFFEYWWFLIPAIVAVLGVQLLEFISRLSFTPLIWLYSVGLAVATAGVSLIFYAKLPLYRQRRFLTFGSRALPESRRSFYRWGYGLVLFAVALLLCLVLTRP